MDNLEIIYYYGKKHVYNVMQELIYPRRYSDLMLINGFTMHHSLLAGILRKGVEMGLIHIINSKYELTGNGYKIFINFKTITA